MQVSACFFDLQLDAELVQLEAEAPSAKEAAAKFTDTRGKGKISSVGVGRRPCNLRHLGSMIFRGGPTSSSRHHSSCHRRRFHFDSIIVIINALFVRLAHRARSRQDDGAGSLYIFICNFLWPFSWRVEFHSTHDLQGLQEQ